MAPRIFITGTGRSGTWILYKALACHSKIHTFPREMRFLVDPDGLMDLTSALTNDYHPVNAREALYRFERLMRVYMAVPERAPYKGFDLPGWLGPDYYKERLDQFCETLIELSFQGDAWQVEPNQEGRLVAWARQLTSWRQRITQSPEVPFRLNLPRNGLKVVKYFSDRAQLVSVVAAFVDDIFLHAARMHGKETWSEKTPQHLLALDFIWELFPDSVVVHIKRDPRGVVQSMTKQFWAPKDLQSASLFMRPVYDRWKHLKAAIDFGDRKYFEIGLEDFAADPQAALRHIAEMCGIENRFENLPNISLERVDYWKNTMSSSEIDLVNGILEDQISWMGYAV